MKVVYLVHQFYPELQAGTEKFVFNMAYMSQKNGNKVKVITYSFGAKGEFSHRSDGILYKEFHYQGLPVLAYRYEKETNDLHNSIETNVNLVFALKILLKEKPDLIHVGHLMRVYPFILAARQLNIPYVLTVTDFYLLCPKVIFAPTPDSLCTGPEHGRNCSRLCSELSSSYIQDRLDVTTKIIRDASAVVAPSRFVAKVFEHEVEGLQVQVIHHGIRNRSIRKNDREYQVGDNICFGYIGNLAVHKGVEVLINAFYELDSSTASLSIFGSGTADYTKKLMEKAGDSNVSFLGAFQADDLCKVLSQIDVLVAPSICYETYSFVVHEALASEVPVITSNLGGMAEQIQSGLNGFTFQAGDQQELQTIMQKIVNEPSILNKFKAHIRLETFVPNIEQEAYKYLQLYKAAIND